MGRPFVTHDNPAAAILLSGRFAFQKHLHATRQKRDFRVLTGHHITQLLDSASKMRNLFFKLFHSCGIGSDPLWVKRRCVFLACFHEGATIGKGRYVLTVLVQTRDRVRIISINRPEVRNAVNPDTATALYEAFLTFESDDSVDVAILTGGRRYSAQGLI